MSEPRTCNVCHEPKPLDAFAPTGFAYPGRERMRRKTCRECFNKAKRGKRCPKCKRYKARKFFYADARRTDGLQTYCKACKNAQVIAWRAQQPAQYRIEDAQATRLRRIRTKRRQWAIKLGRAA